MQLLIIRHAIAVPRGTPDIPDDERPLTPRGEKRFRSAAGGLARLVRRPDVLLSSPLPRARRTAELAAAAWGHTKVTETDALAGGSFQDVEKAIAPHSRAALVAIVGHEPQLSGLLARLLQAEQAQPLTFKKGGAALLEVPGAPAAGGTLVWFLPPRVLRRIR